MEDWTPISLYYFWFVTVVCDLNLVQLLIEKGAFVNEVDTSASSTPLQVACKRGSEDVIKILLKHGANVNATSLFGENVLQEACKLGTSESIIRLLLKNGVDVDASAGGLLYGSALQEACKSGTEDMIKLLVEYGASVKDQLGNAMVLRFRKLAQREMNVLCNF
jgi:ankyrin repeat protein